jgi:glutathione synthase/RimK-type ligase-like ATP-grasp enzyme
MRIALVTAIAAAGLDDDLAPLQDALQHAGAIAEIVAWDDPTVSWSRFDAALLRSTWDYTERLTEFLAWCERIDAQTRLLNPLPVVRWGTDKHYLAELARAGAPVIPSAFLEPGDDPSALPQHDEFVVKPAVGAGSRDTQRYVAAERAQAIEHARRLLDGGRSVLVQPYIAGVDERGETALVYIGGHDSHAIRKGPLLRRGEGPTDALFAAEDIRPRVAQDAEYRAAEAILAALPFARPLYARVDLLPGPDGPLLLELELVEPSLFFHSCRDSAARMARAVLDELAST